MQIKNCKMCGKIYNYVLGPNLCPRCKNAMEDKFQEVKKYIYDNPGVGISEVSEANEVSVQQIRQWVREERLEFTTDSVTGITCDVCGKPIRTGKYCPKCKDDMLHTLHNAYGSTTNNAADKKSCNDDRAKMRYFKI